jgi:catechol 2,3-dioxygenase-like lactoylglutathione lyase family enzyme
MGLSPERIDAVTLFVENLGDAKQFYADVFGLKTVHEDPDSAVFRIGETLINLLSITAAPDLIAPEVVADRDSGCRFQFTIAVDDVDQACDELTRRGVPLLNGPIDRPWGVRTASFTDPGGHIWEIAT